MLNAHLTWQSLGFNSTTITLLKQHCYIVELLRSTQRSYPRTSTASAREEMQLKQLSLVAALVGGAYSQMHTMGLNATLSSTNAVSTLAKTLAMFPGLVSTLANANNITILAPSNAAFQKFLKGPGKGASRSEVEALLTYHVLKGVYLSTDVTSTPAFIPSLLKSPKLSGGEVVEAATMGKDVMFTTGLLQMSMVTQAVGKSNS